MGIWIGDGVGDGKMRSGKGEVGPRMGAAGAAGKTALPTV